MKIQKHKHQKRKYALTLLCVILVIALLLAAAFFMLKPKLTPSENSTTSSTDSSLTSQPSGNTDLDEAQKGSDKSSKGQPDDSQYVDSSKTTNQIEESGAISVSITSLTHKDGMVSYQARVDGATSGKCSAQFTHEIGKPVVRTHNSSNGTCQASIPEQEFDAYGEWTLALRFYANNTQSIDNKTITIQ